MCVDVQYFFFTSDLTSDSFQLQLLVDMLITFVFIKRRRVWKDRWLYGL
jgi:hypothetical protein